MASTAATQARWAGSSGMRGSGHLSNEPHEAPDLLIIEQPSERGHLAQAVGDDPVQLTVRAAADPLTGEVDGRRHAGVGEVARHRALAVAILTVAHRAVDAVQVGCLLERLG